ncbi:hypothetical protein IWQ62_001118 [Dispira parvispora]|uniref:Cytochrome b5 heme-binding domain-containing protein n=1 Tax=Dispira parvispora TaxID=1520584 RepID=A0A9W8AZT4_9FUNG|nr:hypothetical protein IWQ62_001118 [Dispira parvispora]
MSSLRQRSTIKASGPSPKSFSETTPPSTSPSGWCHRLKQFGSLVGIGLLLNLMASFIITESFTWGYQNRYTNWHNWVPRTKLVLSDQELAQYDGSDPSLPIYLAINGRVYDVSASPHYYGPYGAYGVFSGKDAARAWGTNCLQTPSHLTYDVRDLSEDQLAAIKGWQDFYDNHHTYYYVGEVVHEPIDPNTPIPEDCRNGVPKPGN